jgi:hypothetical protein
VDYEGTCYIGVVGPDAIPNQAVISIMNIQRCVGDDAPLLISATKGYEARQQHVDNFMASGHDFLLLLDHDMIFEADTLERLRSHKQPYLSGYYMRRQYAPIYPVWYEPFESWPMRPYLDDPPRDRLVKLGASGWGCILLHRAVIEATRAILHGEPDIIEDDMDVWPYDLTEAVSSGRGLRLLRGRKDIIGSDIRYPFYAAHAGFPLYGDANVQPRHIANYPISCDDYAGQTLAHLRELRQAVDRRVAEAREAA